MSKPPLIAFAHSRWNSLWMNRQHLLHGLAGRGRRVAYSNGIVHYSQFRRMPAWPRVEPMDGVQVLRKGYVLPGTHRMSPLRRAALARHCRTLRSCCGAQAGEPVIGMCFDPELIDHVDCLGPDLRVFHIYDSYNKMQGADDRFAPVRERILGFDLVTASSEHMYRDVTGRDPEPEVIVPNGVDFEAIAACHERPSRTADSIRALPGVKVGYVGSVNTKVDLELVAKLAETLPAMSFVFVGPARTALLRREPSLHAAWCRIQSLRNVHVFEEVDRRELGAVLAALDVGCIFFRTDRRDWVAAGYPLKLNEYLAGGLPVVSSRVRVIEEQFSHVVDVCGDVAEWSDALARHGQGRGDGSAVERRRAVARANDWSHRVTQYDELLDALTARE